MGLRTRRFRNERLVVLVGLGGASALCLGLELVREHRYALDFRFLVWNLILAWIPLLLSLGVYDAYRRGRSLLWLSPMLALWLLFLPNAPYIVTDFVHLSASSRAPLWFDGVELSAFAWTGMLLGFVSLYLVHAVLRFRYGAPLGWSAVLFVLALSGVGVYLGRVKRWNSWDLLTQPGRNWPSSHTLPIPPGWRGDRRQRRGTNLLAASYLVFYLLMGRGSGRTRTDPARRHAHGTRVEARGGRACRHRRRRGVPGSAGDPPCDDYRGRNRAIGGVRSS